ncbi:Ima1 N-terminal domain-containing protein [Aspergillus ambiguus]|uniref:uncharacterized protein n=1 Tax=Aspergillus ambiguus TaxID=176160 RepID=UPI003CCD65CB
MAPLFTKRLSCFYCGQRSAQSQKGAVRKWRCPHCEAINYLDENGEITDPPAAETNPDVYGPGASSPPFETADFTGTGLFCTQCVRNQHLFTSALASYFPPTDDPNYAAYEREYPKFRRNLEERYPQVCVKCEPRVRQRIRQAGYEAKSDHLRRMMDRSKAGRAARQARNWNWRSLLVFAGAIGYWTSIAGQLSWNLWSALDSEDALLDPDDTTASPYVLPCMLQALTTRQVPRSCSVDLAPYAGLSLVAGILSLWYNPKLRLKVEGRGGRFVGLGEYYKVQLIVMVVRCVFWGVLRDPSSSGLEPTLPPALHIFMIFFTILSVLISRRIVKYDTRPLVIWNEDTPTSTPARKRDVSPGQASGQNQFFSTAIDPFQRASPRFPLEKLATPRAAAAESIPTPPPEGDDMDWTPSVQHVQHEIKPTVSVHQRDKKSVLDGPLPFYGSLPAAPAPPSWNLRNRPVQRQKPIEQVVEANPFHRTPNQASNSWGRTSRHSDVSFAPPKFFPMSDHVASTGLESLFDRTFTIKSPEEEEPNTYPSRQRPVNAHSRQPTGMQPFFVFQCLRLGLLLASIAAWALSQHGHLSFPGNSVEVASLGTASLIAGFGLLETLKHPIAEWNGMEILVYFAELAAAVHLGGNLPRALFEREYFDRYGKILLGFMAVQEGLTLLNLYRFMSSTTAPQGHQSNQPRPSSTGPGSLSRVGHDGQIDLQSFNAQSSAPSLSFSSTAAGSSFTTQTPEPQYRKAFPTFDAGLNRDHSFSLSSLKDNESDVSDPLDRDSDTETTMTTATTATNNTIHNIRYGRNLNDTFFSPKRSELGPGLGGLSLEDQPSPRMTRSQTQRMQGPNGARRFPTRGLV